MQLSIHASDQILIHVQLVAAMLLGGLIDLDREAAEKPAGLRTHILVARAAAYFSGWYRDPDTFRHRQLFTRL